LIADKDIVELILINWDDPSGRSGSEAPAKINIPLTPFKGGI
jgi:hypothetical protein